MDKKGWLRIVEVFIAVTVVIGVVMSQIKNIAPEESSSIVLVEKGLMEEMSGNKSLRYETIGYDISGGNKTFNKYSDRENNLIEYLAPKIPTGYNYSVMVCALTDACLLNQKNAYAHERFVAGALDMNAVNDRYNPRKVKLFIWEEK